MKRPDLDNLDVMIGTAEPFEDKGDSSYRDGKEAMLEELKPYILYLEDKINGGVKVCYHCNKEIDNIDCCYDTIHGFIHKECERELMEINRVRLQEESRLKGEVIKRGNILCIQTGELVTADDDVILNLGHADTITELEELTTPDDKGRFKGKLLSETKAFVYNGEEWDSKKFPAGTEVYSNECKVIGKL